MLAKDLSIIQNYALSFFSHRMCTFYHQNTLLDAFRTNSRNIIDRDPSMVIPLLANDYLTPMLTEPKNFECQLLLPMNFKGLSTISFQKTS